MPVKLILGGKIKYRMFVFWGNLVPKVKENIGQLNSTV